MTLPASGAIGLFDVNTELGRTNNAQLGLLCTNVRGLFGDASGAVSMFDGYGKSNASYLCITTSGACVTTCGNYKIARFYGSGSFTCLLYTSPSPRDS